jgi:hypothetical protein
MPKQEKKKLMAKRYAMTITFDVSDEEALLAFAAKTAADKGHAYYQTNFKLVAEDEGSDFDPVTYALHYLVEVGEWESGLGFTNTGTTTGPE